MTLSPVQEFSFVVTDDLSGLLYVQLQATSNSSSYGDIYLFIYPTVLTSGTIRNGTFRGNSTISSYYTSGIANNLNHSNNKRLF